MSAKKDCKIVFFHGYGETTEKVWFPWLHDLLEEEGHPVWAPKFQDPFRPSYARWMKTAEKQAKEWGPDTIIIGHSLGGVVALRAVARFVKTKVKGVVLVGAPFCSTVSVQQLVRFFGDTIDWRSLKRKVGCAVIVHAKNDPIVPYDHAIRYREMLGAKLILTDRDGHFIRKRAMPILRAIDHIRKK